MRKQVLRSPLIAMQLLLYLQALRVTAGKPVVLLTGRHLFNDPLAQWVGAEPLTKPHIELETLHIITVRDSLGHLQCHCHADSHAAQILVKGHVVIMRIAHSTTPDTHLPIYDDNRK